MIVGFELALYISRETDKVAYNKFARYMYVNL